MQTALVNEEQPFGADWAHYANMPIGDILRRARAYYGLTLQDVESALRIRAIQLAALEEGQLEKLPGRVYAIGFVRAYSEFLGLDGDKMVHLFKAQMVGNKARPELNFPAPASESKLPNIYILLGSFAGLALVIGLFMVLTSSPSGNGVPPVPQEQEVAAVFGPPAPAAALAAIAPAAGTAAAIAAPPEAENKVVINVIDSAWVEIRNAQGKPVISRILKAGDSYIVPNEPGFVMDTGNIGALTFTVNGEEIPKLGEDGDVRRNVPLDPEKLTPAASAETKAAAVPVAASAKTAAPAAAPAKKTVKAAE